MLEGCIYYEKNIDYETGVTSTGPKSIDYCELSNGKLLEIVGFSEEFKELHKSQLISGSTRIIAIDAIIQNKKQLLIEDLSKVQLQKIETSKTDDCERSNVRARCNNSTFLQSLKTGKKVFVLRADANDGKTSASVSQLSDSIFGTSGDTSNLKHQYEACSYGQLGIEPVVGTWKRNRITNGVGEVELNMNIKGVDSGIVESEMLLAAQRKYGIYNRKRKGELDLIMLCLPEGTSGIWWAYAYPNHWISAYNDNICLSLSAQMHEVGHNLGLAHSGEDLTYDDMSGYMGYSVADQDGPFKCFNGAKSWQLGWYSDGHESISSMPVNGKREYEGRLIGAAEYKKLELSSDRVIVQINGHQSDYYVSFNAQKGINSGTDEGGDEVLVHSRPIGQDYRESMLVAKLSAGQQYTLSGASDFIVRVDAIDINSSPSYANVFIGPPPCLSDSDCDKGEFCTEYNCDVSTGTCSAIQDCSKCGRIMDVEIMTDNHGMETRWELVNVDNGDIYMQGGPYDNQFLEITSSCVGYGTNELRIYDEGNDGICCTNGFGYYKLKVDSEVIREGGTFYGPLEITQFELTNTAINITSIENPTLSPNMCAPENTDSLECGGNDEFETCCPGLVCNTNKKCVKEENYGCSWKDQVAKECGSKWKDAPDKCCSDFVCGQDTKKCMEL